LPLVTSNAVGDWLRDQHFADLADDAEAAEIWGWLADLPAPVMLVVDDFQGITHDRVLEQVGRWVTNLPPTPLRLVLLSRSDPELPLHGLRHTEISPRSGPPISLSPLTKP
jgi:hypothetical protein